MSNSSRKVLYEIRGCFDNRNASREVTMTELLVAVGLVVGVAAAHEIGFWLGSLTRSADEPFDRQVGLVRTSTAALVAFLLDLHFPGLHRASSIGWISL
jgi:hypothetical protein